MRPLQSVKPTPEQLNIISRIRPGVEVIRGAAGSGKTTTAILRLKALVGSFCSRRDREDNTMPVKVLILTYNRTLRGYIEALAIQETASGRNTTLEIETFARWAFHRLALTSEQICGDACKTQLAIFGVSLGLSNDFLLGEVEYVLSRFMPDNLAEYIDTRRNGRGNVPRMTKELRNRLINEVILPYQNWKTARRLLDWNDLAVRLVRSPKPPFYDIVIVDETQDISANQVRAIIAHLEQTSSATFILDTIQRIYPRGFTWSEVDVNVRPETSHRLTRNYRNTIEIARFATPLVTGIDLGDDDATIPDLSKCRDHGPLPTILVGRNFSQQIAYAVKYVNEIDLTMESVAFLHPKGGGWFDETRKHLALNGLTFVDISADRHWPSGSEQIALSTMASAKGLEFDHVLILGLNQELLTYGTDEEDDARQQLRRLLAMSIARAKKSIVLGYKREERPSIFDLFTSGTYNEITL